MLKILSKIIDVIIKKNNLTAKFLKKMGSQVQIGVYTYGRPKIFTYRSKNILKIGNFCSIADEVKIFLGGNHNVNWITTYPFSAFSEHWPDAKNIVGHPSSKGDVVIGNDVWIGYGAMILSGVKIGDGAVIGANSVVAKDVEAYSVVVGNPAREIKKRFDEEVIKKMLHIKWWNWSCDQINRNAVLLNSTNIDTFVNKFYNNKGV